MKKVKKELDILTIKEKIEWLVLQSIDSEDRLKRTVIARVIFDELDKLK